MSKAESLLRALTSSFGARLAMAALNFGLFWELSHRFDATRLGGYSVLMNIFFMVQGLPLLGLSAPLARRTASDPPCLQRELSNALVMALPMAAIIGLAIAGAGWLWYDPALWLSFALLGLAILPSGWVLVAETALLGRERMSVVARVQCLEALGRALCAVVAVEMGAGISGVFAVFLVWRCVAAWLYARHAELPRPRQADVTLATLRRNLGEVPVFLGIALATVVATRVDVIALGHLVGLQAAGVYAAAARLYEAALMLPTIAAMVMLPALARLYQNELGQFRQMLLRSLRLSLGAGFAVALAVAALAEPLITTLYASPLHGAVPVLRLLIVGAVLMTADQLLSSTMMAAKAQHEDLRTMLLALVAVLLGLVLLVPAWGAVGAATAVLLALLLRVLWRLRWAARSLALVGLWSDLARLGLAWGLSALALALGLQWGPLQALALAWAVYALALLGLGLLPWAWLLQLNPLKNNKSGPVHPGRH